MKQIWVSQGASGLAEGTGVISPAKLSLWMWNESCSLQAGKSGQMEKWCLPPLLRQCNRLKCWCWFWTGLQILSSEKSKWIFWKKRVLLPVPPLIQKHVMYARCKPTNFVSCAIPTSPCSQNILAGLWGSGETISLPPGQIMDQGSEFPPRRLDLLQKRTLNLDYYKHDKYSSCWACA